MKIVAFVSTLDLRFRLGCVPAWWQLLKAINEIGNEVVVVPYLGREIETPWWRSYPNPWRLPGETYHVLARRVFPKRTKERSILREGFVRLATRSLTLPVWKRHLTKILKEEKDVDAAVFLGIPLNQITGIPEEMKREFGIKTVFCDGDMPTILPEHGLNRGFMFDYYHEANLQEYDLFLVNSEGVIRDLEKRGARKVRTLHYAADPGLFKPLPIRKDFDVAFFGYGSQTREKWLTRMIAEPSVRMPNKFAVGGGDFAIPLGRAEYVGDIPMSTFRQFCCSSRINLNIARDSFASIYASSTARPFELAAMGCCIVSCPYNGLEKWFTPGREIIILSDDEDICGLYEHLLSDESERLRIGQAARERVLKDHTYQNRAQEVIEHISEIKSAAD